MFMGYEKNWCMYPLMMALKTGSMFMEIVLTICKYDQKEFSLSEGRRKGFVQKFTKKHLFTIFSWCKFRVTAPQNRVQDLFPLWVTDSRIHKITEFWRQEET